MGTPGGCAAADAVLHHGWRRAEWVRRMDSGLCAHYGRCGAYHTFPCAGCVAVGELPRAGSAGNGWMRAGRAREAG